MDGLTFTLVCDSSHIVTGMCERETASNQEPHQIQN